MLKFIPRIQGGRTAVVSQAAPAGKQPASKGISQHRIATVVVTSVRTQDTAPVISRNPANLYHVAACDRIRRLCEQAGSGTGGLVDSIIAEINHADAGAGRFGRG